jgi:hypothetical protein
MPATLPPPRPRRKAKDHRAQGERKVAGPTRFMSLRGALRRSNLNPPGGRLPRCAANAQNLVFLARIFGCGRRPPQARNDMGAEPSDDCVFALPPGGTQPAWNDMLMISPASPGVLCGSVPGIRSHFPACLRLQSLRPQPTASGPRPRSGRAQAPHGGRLQYGNFCRIFGFCTTYGLRRPSIYDRSAAAGGGGGHWNHHSRGMLAC